MHIEANNAGSSHLTIPQEFRNTNIIHLYKRKGDRASCDNHRGIFPTGYSKQNTRQSHAEQVD